MIVTANNELSKESHYRITASHKSELEFSAARDLSANGKVTQVCTCLRVF